MGFVKKVDSGEWIVLFNSMQYKIYSFFLFISISSGNKKKKNVVFFLYSIKNHYPLSTLHLFNINTIKRGKVERAPDSSRAIYLTTLQHPHNLLFQPIIIAFLFRRQLPLTTHTFQEYDMLFLQHPFDPYELDEVLTNLRIVRVLL